MPVTQSVVTILTGWKFILPCGILFAFCIATNRSSSALRWSSHTTASMYSPSCDDTETTKEGASWHSLPSTLIEQCSGKSTICPRRQCNIKLTKLLTLIYKTVTDQLLRNG